MSETLTAPAGFDKFCPELQQAARALAQLPALKPEDAPLTHRHTPGLTTREIYMRKGQAFVTRIHKWEHQFIVSQGRCRVWAPETGWVEIAAPYHGITTAGTQRALVVLEDTIWTTMHVTDITDPDELVAWATEPMDRLEQVSLAQWLGKLEEGEG